MSAGLFKLKEEKNEKKKKREDLSDENSVQGVWEGKPQRRTDKPFIPSFCLSRRDFF